MGASISALQIFQVLRYGAILLVSVALTRSHWDKFTIGTWESILLLSGLASFWWMGGLINALVPLYSKTPAGHRKALWKSTRTVVFGLGLLTAGLLLVCKPLILMWFAGEQSQLGANYTLLLVYIALNIPAYLSEYYLLLNEQNRALTIHAVVLFLLQLGIVATLPLLGYDLHETLIGLCVFAGLKLCSLYFWQARYPMQAKSLSAVGASDLGVEEGAMPINWNRHLLTLAAPLMLAMLLGGLSTYIDGLIVLRKLDMESFAIFQYGAKELPLVLVMANALSTAAAAGISIREKRDNTISEIKQRSLRMMHFFFPLSVLLMVGSQWLYPLVFTESFQESAQIFNIYLLLLFSRLLFPQTILTGLQRNKIQLISAALEVILNISLSLALLPNFGLLGVAFATVVAHLFDKLFLMSYLWLTQGIPPQRYTALPTYAIYAVLLFGLWWWML